MSYRFLPHTADIKVAIVAESFDDLLADGAAALRRLLVGSSPVAPRERQTLTLQAADHGELLLRYLQDLLVRFDTDRFVPGDVAVETSGATHVTAHIRGERFDPAKHDTQPEVKAVTRHGFVVEQRRGRWRAEVLFDV